MHVDDHEGLPSPDTVAEDAPALYEGIGNEHAPVFRRAIRVANIGTAAGRNCGRDEITVSGLLSRTASARNAPEVDVTIRVPDVEVYVESGRCTAQTYFYAAYVLIRIQLQVANVGDFNTTDEFVVLLLLFTHSF
jgi:hypothetical protein